MRTTLPTATAALAALVALPALAGPPSVCHRIETGGAPSLPWGDGPGWNQPDAGYDREDLVTDTLELLDGEAPVLARMETIRRATIYASEDGELALDLLGSLLARVAEPSGAVTPALAWFDAGYLAAAYVQGHHLFERRGNEAPSIFARRLEPLPWLEKSLELSGGEPDIAYAAALATWAPRRPGHLEHRRRAKEGAAGDPLLAKNLLQSFGGEARDMLGRPESRTGRQY